MVGIASRTTMDMDVTIKGYPVNEDTIQRMIEEIVKVPVNDISTIFENSLDIIKKDYINQCGEKVGEYTEYTDPNQQMYYIIGECYDDLIFVIISRSNEEIERQTIE